MDQRRVLITGLGVITPIGVGADALWAGLRRGTSAVREVTRFDAAPFRSRIAAEVRDFHPTDHIEARRARRLDRFSQFSVAATRLALQDAELALEREDRDRIGAMMGTALGGVAHGEAQSRAFYLEGPKSIAMLQLAAPANTLSASHGSTDFGPSR